MHSTFTRLTCLLLLIAILLLGVSCQKEIHVLDGQYVYYLGDEIPTFSYVFEGVTVTMYVAGELQAQGTYFIDDDKIHLSFEVDTIVGKYDRRKDQIVMMTSDYGEIVLHKVDNSDGK